MNSLEQRQKEAEATLQALINDDNATAEQLQKAGDAFNNITEKLNAKQLISNRDNMNKATDKELVKYNFADALLYATNPETLTSEKRGFYAEMQQEAEHEARQAGVTLTGAQGVVIPSKVVNATTAGNEYSDVGFDEAGSFVDYLNNKSVLAGLGAEFLQDLTGNLRFPRESTVPTATWEAENDETTESASDFDNVTLSPKRLSTYIEVSAQLLKQASPSINERLQNQLYGSLSRGIEHAAINGGNADAPTGIIDIATEVTASDAYAKVIQLESELSGNDADLDAVAYLMNAKTRGELKTAKKDTGSGRFVMEGNNELNGYRAGVTNMVEEETGTAPLNSPLIFGNFSDLIIGQWGGIEIIFNPYTQAKKGMVELIANVYADIGILHNESFAYASVETTSA